MVASRMRCPGAVAGTANRHSTRRNQRQVPPVLPSEAEVLRSVWSLYGDELRPYGRLLRKRLAEQLGPRGNRLQSCTDSQLRTICEISPSLRVEHEELRDGVTGEWSALLVSESPTFVDVYSEDDVYPEEVWSAAEAHFEAAGSQLVLPRGRYASAHVLHAQCLPFLAGCTLGRVCHFLQIALSKRKLLGYVDGGIVPYAHSMSMVKARCAQQRRPLPSGAAAPLVADLASARATLREILELRGTPLPLSNIKRLFSSLYNLELSETALGHTTLTGLLNDPHFHDICEVHLQGRYHVARARQPVLAAESVAPKLADDFDNKNVEQDDPPLVLPGMQNIVNKGPLRQQSPPPVRHTFIHFRNAACHEPSSPEASRRSSSWPQVGTGAERPLPVDDECQKDAKTTRACFSNQEPLCLFPDEQLCLMDPSLTKGLAKNTLEASPLMTPSPLYTAKEISQSLPLRPNAWEATCLALGMEPIDQGHAAHRGSKRAREKGSHRGQPQSNFEDDEESQEDDHALQHSARPKTWPEFTPQHSTRAGTPEREEPWQWQWLPAASSFSGQVGSSRMSGESLLEHEKPKPQEPTHCCAGRRLRPRAILASDTSTGPLLACVPTADVLQMETSRAKSAQLPPADSPSALPFDIPGARLASAALYGLSSVDIPGAHVSQVPSHNAVPSEAPGACGISWLLPAATARCPPASFVEAGKPGATLAAVPAGVAPASAEGWVRHLPPPQLQHHQPYATSHGMYATPILRLACMI